MEMRRLGQRGPEVSALSLGVASFGDQWGPYWTTDIASAQRLLAIAVDAGVTYLDTSNVYNRGRSEEWLGALLARGGLRDQVVVSTKFGYRTDPDDPDAGGSGRAAMRASVERSLRRLRIDRLDLLYLQLWDRQTPPEETLAAAAELSEEGKIGHFALSNVPGWYVGEMHGRAAISGVPGPVCVQMHYNLLIRSWEYEFADLLRYAGLGVVSWGPLANGLLAGRYDIRPDTRTLHGEGRLTRAAFSTGSIDPFAPRVGRVLGALRDIAHEVGRPGAQVALAWLLVRPHVSSVLLGVSTEEQLCSNLAAADLDLGRDLLARLDDVSASEAEYPYMFLQEDMQRLVHGDRPQPG